MMMDRLSANPFLTQAVLRQGAQMRNQLQTALAEMSSAQQQDIGKAVQGDYGILAGIDHQIARLGSYKTIADELSLRAGMMQKALGAIDETAQNLAVRIFQSGTPVSASGLATISQTGAEDFRSVIALLNSGSSDRSLFGGTRTEQPPLPAADVILASAATAVSAALSAEDVSLAIEAWLSDPGGFASLYQGGDAAAPLPVSAGGTAQLAVTALDPAIRDTLSGLIKIALINQDSVPADPQIRAEIVRSAGEDIQSAAEGRALTMARIGTVEQNLTRELARNSAESAALTLRRNGLTGADPYEVATRLEDLQSRLDAFYAITARLSRLSLTEYLR